MWDVDFMHPIDPGMRAICDTVVNLLQQTAMGLLMRPYGRADKELAAEPLPPPMYPGGARGGGILGGGAWAEAWEGAARVRGRWVGSTGAAGVPGGGWLAAGREVGGEGCVFCSGGSQHTAVRPRIDPAAPRRRPARLRPPHPPPAGNREARNLMCRYGGEFAPLVDADASEGWEFVNEGGPKKPKWGFISTVPGTGGAAGVREGCVCARVRWAGGQVAGAGQCAGWGWVAWVRRSADWGCGWGCVCVGRGAPAC